MMDKKIILTGQEQEYLDIYKEMCKRGTEIRELKQKLKVSIEALEFLKKYGVSERCGDDIGCKTVLCDSGKCKYYTHEYCSFEKWLDIILTKIGEME